MAPFHIAADQLTALIPVIGRELRSASRQPFTYHLRTLAVGALLLASLFFALQHGFTPGSGGGLFGYLHFTLFLVIWIFVPVLAADSLSRERREGTLGLLFLTGLRAGNIVAAKGFSNVFRALTLWLTILPVMALPILLGGVSWSEAMLSAMANFSAICWALAAGLMASAWSTAWVRAILWSLTLAVGCLFLMAFSVGCLLLAAAGPSGVTALRWNASTDFILAVGFGFISNATHDWSFYLRLAPVAQLVSVMVQASVFSVIALALAILAAGARTRRVWQEEPPSARQLWWHTTFCTPVVWRPFFRSWLQRKLDRNPIGWLEQRTWTGRIVTWGWFAVVMSLYSAVFSDRNFIRGYSGLQKVLAWLMIGSIAMTAAGSFRRERETGVLELLLVSPLGEAYIIWGRLRGLWGQFLPAICLFLGIWIYFASVLPDQASPGVMWFYSSTFFTLPIAGLYYSLRCRNFITAFLAAISFGLLGPIVFSAVVDWLLWFLSPARSYYWIPGNLNGWTILFQLVMACVYGRQLHQRLKHRTFPLERPDK